MKIVNRREAIRGTGLALLTPFTASLNLRSAVPQTSNQNSAAGSPSNMFHAGLAHHVMDIIANTSASRAKAEISQEDLIRTSSVVRMYGTHLQQSGFDSLSKYIVDAIDPANADLSNSEGVNVFHAHLLKYNPNANVEDIKNRLRFSSANATNAKKSLATSPISSHFHVAADLMYYKARSLSSTSSRHSLQTAGHSVHHQVMPAVYRGDQHYGLYREVQLTNLSQKCLTWVKTQFCNLMTDDKAQAVVTGAIGYSITTFGLAGACAALAAGSIALTAATDGGAAGSAIAAWGACDIIATIPSALIANVGVAVAVQTELDDFIDATC